MPRTKGTPKTGGRKKGTPNKTTADLKKWVFQFVNDNLEDFDKKFKDLEFPEKVAILLKLLPYVLPKQSENKITVDDDLAKSVKESMDKINNLFN